ncbi:hypothetical protein CCP2SC5_290024 [Azospirillaceae bacterium]
MYSTLMGLYSNMDQISKLSPEDVTARSARASAVVQKGYQLWLNFVTEGMNDAAKAVKELSSCRSPVEASQIQQAWVEVFSTRAVVSLNVMMELTTQLVAELTPPVMSANQPPALPALEPPKSGSGKRA